LAERSAGLTCIGTELGGIWHRDGKDSGE